MAGLVLGAAADTEESWLRTARRRLERGLLHVNTVTPLITPHTSQLLSPARVAVAVIFLSGLPLTAGIFDSPLA